MPDDQTVREPGQDTRQERTERRSSLARLTPTPSLCRAVLLGVGVAGVCYSILGPASVGTSDDLGAEAASTLAILARSCAAVAGTCSIAASLLVALRVRPSRDTEMLLGLPSLLLSLFLFLGMGAWAADLAVLGREAASFASASVSVVGLLGIWCSGDYVEGGCRGDNP